MLKIPMAFKGPQGVLQNLFSNDVVYRATLLVLNKAIVKWQYKEHIEIIQSQIVESNNKHTCSLNWPIQNTKDDPLGSCTCQNDYPCVHLAALAIESKVRLDQLPAFTQQLQASQNIAETFSNWMQRQTYDPYPNMARHRLIYLLDFNSESNRFTLALHKAYISTEERYSLKAKLDSSLIDKSSLPKFVTIADQRILYLIKNSHFHGQHLFEISDDFDKTLFKEILLTGRCFWRACYRSPLEFTPNVSVISANTKRIAQEYYFSIQENSIVTKINTHTTALAINPNNEKITPRLRLNSHQIHVHASNDHFFDLHVAKITFLYKDHEFSFADLSNGKVLPSSLLLKQMASYLRQLENLDSVFAHFEPVVLQNFHLNDRYLPADFTEFALLLRGLQRDGWEIIIDENYHLNRKKIKQWYIDLKQESDSSRQKWFEMELGININGQSINIMPYIIQAINSGQWKKEQSTDLNLVLEDGSNIDLDQKNIKQILSTLTELYDKKALNKDQQLQLSSSQLFRVQQLTQSLASHDSDIAIELIGEKWLTKKAEQLNVSADFKTIAAPVNLKAQLRDYQLTGVSWLQFLSKNQLGGILADDMGLGKTLQVLAHLLLEKQQGRLTTPCLIVVPTSLLSNWQTEIKKFTPNLNALLLSGNQRNKLYPQIQAYDIIIMSYGVMSRDINILKDYNFYQLILDEAQTIKNAKTRAAKSASSLNTELRLCLSGTPIENHLGELWSLFHFLMPGFLGQQKQFEQLYQIPIERLKDQERQKELSHRVSPFMLRRTKAEVATELPKKTEIVQLIELNDSQANLYEALRLSMNSEIQSAFNKSNSDAPNKIIIGNALLRLRQVCCHPALLKLDSIEANQESAKLNWLTTVIPNMIEEGRKILLFSSFTTMLDLIKTHLSKLGIKSLMLTGKTAASKRGGLIESFQSGDIPIFLISLKAGGAGINLTAADTVIHFDPWWNPAAESQASDRAHRIGQNKNVFVYKLISKGTIEQRIHNLQKHKHDLAQSILSAQGSITSVLNQSNWQEFLRPIDN